MKFTRSFLSILLIFGMLSVFFPLGASAETSAKTGQGETAEKADLGEEVFHIACDICPVEMLYAKNIKVAKKLGNQWEISFDTVYGAFRYRIDPETREVMEKEEPDIEAARKQKDFREPIASDELLDAVFKACPLDLSETGKLKTVMQPDGNCAISFNSAYGDFLYVVDPFTGKIVDRQEPDMEKAKADPDFKPRLSVDEIVDRVFKACPIDIALARKIHTKLRADDRWNVDFTSAYGDFLYVADCFTGEILEKTEPDIEAARKQPGFQEPLDADAVISKVFAECPITIDKATKLKVSLGADENWKVSFGSAYGDFLYVVDSLTGKIIDRTEPDVETAKAQGTAKEPLNAEEAINKVISICPIKPPEMKNIKASKRSDGNWTVTFGSDYGDFLYIVDGSTGAILEKTEPEVKKG